MKILFNNFFIMENTNLWPIENNVKIVWLLHFIGNIISGWLLGTLLVIWYLLFTSNIDEKTKKVCYHIINFNLSFWIYFAIGFVLMFVLIWFIILPIVAIIWIIILVIWFIKHLAWDDYEYPLAIEFLK